MCRSSIVVAWSDDRYGCDLSLVASHLSMIFFTNTMVFESASLHYNTQSEFHHALILINFVEVQ